MPLLILGLSSSLQLLFGLLLCVSCPFHVDIFGALSRLRQDYDAPRQDLDKSTAHREIMSRTVMLEKEHPRSKL